MVWFLAFLGIAISFLVKFAKRTNKERSWSIVFWVKDNWAETVASVLMVIALVIIFKEATFDDAIIRDKLPWIASLPMDKVVALATGYLNNVIFYALIKRVKGK